MSKRLILILALAFVVGIACAAYAETQNVKVSGDLEFMSVFRDSFDLKGKNSLSHDDTDNWGRSDNIFLTIVRPRIDADLTDNVSATVRLIGEWIWGQEDNNNPDNWQYRDSTTGIDIDLAYATLKEFLYSPLTLIVGRQELQYGNGMIIGDRDTNQFDYRGNIPGDLSKRKAFDAVRAILDYNPLTVDLVYTKISSGLDGNVAGNWIYNDNGERVGNRRDDDVDLYGVNAKYEFSKTTLGEAYYWYTRMGPRAFYPVGTGAEPTDYKSDQLHTFGARIATQPIKDLTYQLEAALQRGRYNSDFGAAPGRHVADYAAWALETSLTYDWKKAKTTPSATALFGIFSGDDGYFDSIITDRYKGWTPLAENQTFGHIANALVSQTNLMVVGLNGSMKPKEDITLKGEFYKYWFVNPPPVGAAIWTDYYGNGLRMESKRGAGAELDLTATYDYTEDVQFRLLTGLFFPGGAFADENNRTASEVVGSMKVTF